MKKIYAIALGLALVLGARAQTPAYHAMPDSNATWCEKATWGVTCGVEENRQLEIGGDTVIGSMSYHKMLGTGEQHCNMSYYYFTHQYVGAFRQDTTLRQVYWVTPNATSEELLYDFTLGVGDTTPADNGMGLIITSIDSVLIGSDYRTRYWGNNGMMMPDSACIVEGIGCSLGFYYFGWQGVEFISNLRVFSENGVELFIPDSALWPCPVITTEEGLDVLPEIHVAPNPSSGNFTLSYSYPQTGNVYVTVADLSGRMVQQLELDQVATFRQELDCSDLESGIYLLIVSNGERSSMQRIVIAR